MSSYLINELITIPSVYLFIYIYIVRFVIVIRGDDWFIVWLGLEINIMSFLVLAYKRGRIISIESCLKYFFIQSLGSVLLIGSFYLRYNLIAGIASIVVAYKVGAGPFFYWFPSVCSGLRWSSCYLLMVFQRVLPLALIIIFIHWTIWIIIMISLLVGVVGSFNQRNIKQLLAYSSVHHLGWIFIIGIKSNIDWIIYLIIYGLILLSVVVLLLNNEIVDLSIIYISENKVWFILRILRIAGIPPLLGFYLKWIALVNIIGFGILYLIILVMVSVVILYVYMRVVYDVIMGGGCDISWVRNYYRNYLYGIDILRVLGIVGGIFLGIYFVYY